MLHQSKKRKSACQIKQSPWAELQTDILAVIFQKLGAVEVLLSAQAVCHAWRQLALDPDCQVWRWIDMRYLSPAQNRLNLGKLTRVAVDRGGSKVDKLYARSLSDDDLAYIIKRCTKLKIFCLISSKDVSRERVVDFVGKCLLLEELHICACGFKNETFGDIGRARPDLKSLWVDVVYMLESDNQPKLDVNKDSDSDSDYLCDHVYVPEEPDSDYESDYITDTNITSESESIEYFSDEVVHPIIDKDEKAVHIANNMPQLRELRLAGDSMSDKGLHAILDKCIHLEFLDIRGCYNILYAVEDLRAKLAKIKIIRI